MSLVLLPGMMCDARLFEPQLATFPDATTVTPAGQNTIAGMAQEVLAQSPPRFALAGLSMGGIVAMEIMRIAPERVRKLALLDTNHRAEKDAVRANRLVQINAVENGQLVEVMRDEMKPRYLADGSRRAEILETCMHMAVDLGSDAFIDQSHALMGRSDQTETLREVQCPTLVLCGAEDGLCPVSTHQDIADLLPSAEFIVIENAGHLPTLEQPVATNAALSRWLEAA